MTTTDYVTCPVCGEPDMPKKLEPSAPKGKGYITCMNLACASNGGDSAAVLLTRLGVAKEGSSKDAARVEEKRSHLHDEVPAGAIGLDEIGGMCGSYIDARTFANEGLCVYVIPGEGALVFTVEQARKAAKEIQEMAERVEAARLLLRPGSKLR